MGSRRAFIKKTVVSGLGLGLGGSFSRVDAEQGILTVVKTDLPEVSKLISHAPDIPFVPRRAASWWNTIEDLQWSQKHVRDKIKRRAEAFAEAKIDMAINFGFHCRFDFSNYFGQVHGYLAEVCEELHKYGIKFMDHFSCNNVFRPRDENEFRVLHRGQRHAVLLFHDPVAAKNAQYEGHHFQDLCEIEIRDGSRGYARQYQMESFCHNNPGFLDMHVKYLKRLLNEVPIDAIEVDDMCDYPGLATCGCTYCRERFRRDYGQEIPSFDDKNFWGDTSKPMLLWGNYDNPVFREFIRMKADGIVDHVKLIKHTVGTIPLMTCCSSTGPIILNSISLNLERMAPYLDFFMLENCGTNVRSANWHHIEAEALHQKDIAKQRGDAVAIALSYTIYEKGGYLGWAISRFWGVANWSSTLNDRQEETPTDAREMEEVIREWNNWEVNYSNLDYRKGEDLPEVRLVSNSYCRDNGWRDEKGKELWDRLRTWSQLLIKHNIGYRFLRTNELANAEMLKKERTPLVLDGVACVSDTQFKAISSFLASGGTAWLALPFGVFDEKGFKRQQPLSDLLLRQYPKYITVIDSTLDKDPLPELIRTKKIQPVIEQLEGDPRWAVRIRMFEGKYTLHFMNTAMQPTPHPTLKDNGGIPFLLNLDSQIKDNNLSYRLHLKLPKDIQLEVMSPETKERKQMTVLKKEKGGVTVKVDLTDINIYAVAQQID